MGSKRKATANNAAAAQSTPASSSAKPKVRFAPGTGDAPAAGEHKSVAAQWARAKALKEKEEAEKGGVVFSPLGGQDTVVGEPADDKEKLGKAKTEQLAKSEEVNEGKRRMWVRNWWWSGGLLLWML
jgi:hypothetical protein